MNAAARIAVEFALAIVVSLLLLTVWQLFLGAAVADAFGEGARLLFLFMDVGLGVWLVLLIVWAARRGALGAGRTLLFAVAGVLANLVTVIVVGFIQGGWEPLFVAFALEAGVAVLVGAAIVVPLVHRLGRATTAP